MRLIDVTSWCYNHDLMTDAFYIEEDRQRGNRELTEIERTLLVLGAALVVWLPFAILLWP